MLAIATSENRRLENVFREHAVLDRAAKAVGEYSRVIHGAYDDSLGLLNAALTATYEAVCDLQRNPTALADLLNKRCPGPASANPVKPIVRKLWNGVPVRETIHRYASMIALAMSLRVKPKDFSEWLKNYRGGIKGAAAAWTRGQKRPDTLHESARAKIAERDEFLARQKSTPLPEELGLRDPGLYLSVIRVSDGGKAEHVMVLDSLSPNQVNAMIRQAQK